MEHHFTLEAKFDQVGMNFTALQRHITNDFMQFSFQLAYS
jgi:hypothetical protein